MEDLIKRSDAIKALKDNREFIDGDAYPFDCACDVIEAIPSADRPQGKWIDKGADLDGTWYYQCSNCHADVIEEQYPNCPYCLARMKGAGDE